MIQVITRGRGAGKTFKAEAWLRANPNRVLIVASSDLARDMIRRNGPGVMGRVVTLKQYLGGSGARSRPDVEVGIDNADLILAELLSTHVSLVTFTGVTA